MGVEPQSLNPMSFLQDIMGFTEAQRPKSSADIGIKLATVDSAYQTASFASGTLPRVTFDGESTLSEKFYPVMGPYWPKAGDRVALVPVGTTYMIIGPISSTNAISAGGNARIGGTLSVTGTTTLTGAVSIVGALTLSSTLRVPHIGDISLSSTNHAFQIGSSTGVNLRMDANEIQGVNNGAASGITLQRFGGSLTIGDASAQVGTTHNGTLTVTPTQSASSQAIALNHGMGIYADNVNVGGGAGSRLWIDVDDGADVIIGPRGGSERINDLRLRTSTIAGAANMSINTSTFRVTIATSSRKYKEQIEDYVYDDAKMQIIKKVRPITYYDKSEVREKGLENSKQYAGFLAEDLHDLGLTEMVTYKDGEPDGVTYDRMSVLLFGWIAELQEEINQLKKGKKK